MHEWALAEAVVNAVLQIAEREGLKAVNEVTIRIGELQQVELDIFEFALSQLKSGVLKGARFVFEMVEGRLKCRVCGHEWSFSREKLDEDSAEAVHFVPETIHAFVKCPRCGSPDFDVVQGRGVWLESVKGVR
ncbi:hydrogenase nickel incorporation protein HypA [Candidatus Bathyarchaeota archaeon]|nr:hydrogenase nickel incorporation protein HypA [Candidatus Bathyarchaeota archaeon]